MKYFLYTLIFSTTLFFASCEKKIGCTDFKTGKYLISNDTIFDSSAALFKTEKTQQQINAKGDTLFAKVKWLNDCSYILTFDKSKMMLSPFQINVNNRGGILVEFGIPEGNIMPYTSILKGETKTETLQGFLKKVN